MADVLYTNVGGILVAEDRGGVYSNYLSDTLGSVRKIFSGGASAVTDTFTYWPYGEEFSRTGTNPTPFTWVGTLGYFRDAAKRFYVRMRSYLADVGSWMRVDPLWPIERAYGYVGGRAVDGVDPRGLGPCEDEWGDCMQKVDDKRFYAIQLLNDELSDALRLCNKLPRILRTNCYSVATAAYSAAAASVLLTYKHMLDLCHMAYLACLGEKVAEIVVCGLLIAFAIAGTIALLVALCRVCAICCLLVRPVFQRGFAM